MKKIAITNNPMSRDKFFGHEVEFHDTDYLGVLKIVRDRIHLGHRLLTHPLAGSVKPGETPYRTIIISAEKGELDEKALLIIEDSRETGLKLTKKNTKRSWNEEILADFQLIDYSLVFGRE